MNEQEKFIAEIKELQSTDVLDYRGFYNKGYELLQMLDLNGDVPEIFICSGNRTAGKTFFFKRLIVRYAIQTGNKFLMLTRKKTQLTSSANSFIADIENCEDFCGLFEVNGSDFAGVKSIAYEKIIIGYVSYLNYADDIKEASNMFNDVGIIVKDEFQAPTLSGYVENEIGKLRSIHKSVARCFGKHVRFVPCILISNMISIINPYFVAFGIHTRLNSSTRKMRGNGWVFQIEYNKKAVIESNKSKFEQAFGEDEQSRSDNHNIFMDNTNLVGKISEPNMRLVFVFYINKRAFGLWLVEGKYYYVSTKIDNSCPRLYSLDIESHNERTTLIQKYDPVWRNMQRYFDAGYFRFQDMECKSAMINAFTSINI